MKNDYWPALAVAVVAWLAGLVLTLLGLALCTAMPSMASADGVTADQSLLIAGMFLWHLLPYALALTALVAVPWRWPRHTRALAAAVAALPLIPLLIVIAQFAEIVFITDRELTWLLLPPVTIGTAGLLFFVARRFSPPAT